MSPPPPRPRQENWTNRKVIRHIHDHMVEGFDFRFRVGDLVQVTCGDDDGYDVHAVTSLHLRVSDDFRKHEQGGRQRQRRPRFY